jgi:RNA polymerase sigma factor (sigma-70 family)
MVGHPLSRAIRKLLRRVSVPPSAGVTDAELLDRFVQWRDEAAFETLLLRHGPTVLGVCRRTLRHKADSEDCFQAVFLVFCRRAATISKRHSLGSWLYKVAFRICLRMRAARSRQSAAPANVHEPAAIETVSDSEHWELRRVLDEELNRLPERYRAPLILHYLEEKTVAQVGLELGWHPGTVCSRLARGKELLRLRLSRRGVTLSAAAMAAAMAPSAVAAALPHHLGLTTLQAVRTGTISRSAAVLAQEFMRTQLLGRLKWLFALMILLGTATAGAGIILSADRSELPASSGTALSDLSAMLEGPIRADPDGDALPPGAIRRLGSARFRHGGFVHAMAYSPDGQTLTTTSGGGVIRGWDAATGRPKPSIRNKSLASEEAFALSTDGTLLATNEVSHLAYDPGPVKISLAALPSHQIKCTLEAAGGAPLRTIAISRDAKRVAAGGGFNSLLVWNTATGEPIRRLPLGARPAQCERVALSPDGRLLAARDNGKTLRLWNVESGEERDPLLPGGSFPTSFAFSGDGRVLACGDGYGRIRLWDPQTSKAIHMFSPPNNRSPRGQIEGVAVLAISSDGKVVATAGGEGSVRLWDATTGVVRAELVKPTGTRPNKCHALAFSPDDKHLALGGESPEITIWDVATGGRIHLTGEPDAFPCHAVVSPIGDTVATTCGDKVQLWDARTGRRSGTIASRGKWLAFSPDGSALATPGVSWEVATGKQRDAANVEPSFDHPAMLRAMGRLGELEPRKKLWWIRGSTQRPAAISPDGLVCAWPLGNQGDGAGVMLFATISGQKLDQIRCSGRCWSAAFCPDGQTIALAGEDFAELREVSSGRMVRQFVNVPHDTQKLANWRRQALAVSPDGKLLAANDGWAIRVWDIPSGMELDKFSGHNGPILSLAFFPDSRTLISGSEDTTALIWDVSHLSQRHKR